MLSGLPGAGKSEIAQGLARRLPAVVVSVDPIEDAIVRSGIPMSFETGLAAYNVGGAVASAQLRNGFSVIADAANYLEVGRDIWRRAAAEASAPIRAIEIICSDLIEHRRRLESRRRNLVAYPEPTWAGVTRRMTEIEPWSTERHVIDTIQPLESSLADAMRYLVR